MKENCKIEKPASKVDEWIEDIYKNISQIKSTLKVLEDKMSSSLKPYCPEPEVNYCSSEDIDSDLSKNLRDISINLSEINQAQQSLIDRCDL